MFMSVDGFCRGWGQEGKRGGGGGGGGGCLEHTSKT